MSWHNLSGKEFDSKIKAHFEGMEVPFAEPSWELMSKKLDNQGNFKKNHAGNNRWLLGLILIGATVFFWNLLLNTPDGSNVKRANFTSKEVPTTQNTSSNDKTSPQKKQQAHQKPQEQNNSKNPSQGLSDASADPKMSEHSQQVNSESSEKLQSSPLKNSSTTDLVNEGEHANLERTNNEDDSDTEIQFSKGGDNQHIKDFTTDNNPGAQVNAQQDASLSTQKLNVSEGHSQAYEANRSFSTSGTTTPDYKASDVVTEADERVGGGNAQYQSQAWATLQLLTPKLPGLNWMQLRMEHIPSQLNLAKGDAEPPIVTPPQPKWSIGVGYAPDISLVGFSEITKPGTNVAVNVDYRLGSRWSVQTGATVAKKNYIADGADYSPPAGFWGYGMLPDQADATCTVIDIPINIRYYFGRKNNWYAATGLSSYLMLRENYDYTYDHDYPGTVDNWAVRNENQHFLGVYNLSIGYQKQLASRWFLEIEPFIKAPISGIGFGRVGLWSTGTLFSIRYQIPKKH